MRGDNWDQGETRECVNLDDMSFAISSYYLLSHLHEFSISYRKYVHLVISMTSTSAPTHYYKYRYMNKSIWQVVEKNIDNVAKKGVA